MKFNKYSTVFYNGEFKPAYEVSLSLLNQSLHYGNAVFEGIRSYQTSSGIYVFKAREHYERLLLSAKLMRFNFNYSVEELTELTYLLLEKNKLADAYIRPIVLADENMGLTLTGRSNVLITAWEWDKLLGDKLVRVMVSSYERPNPKAFHVHAKVSGHYVNSLLATSEAKQNGYDEALLLDRNGFVAEGPGANFFYIKDDKLYTPSKDNILPGITRNTIIELAQELCIPVVEEQFKPTALLTADGAFFTGTAAEIAGIESINGQKFKMNFYDTVGNDLVRKFYNTVRKPELVPVIL